MTPTNAASAVRLVPFVALGGAVGAMLRHLVEWAVHAVGGGVGLGLMIVNLLGAFLIGVVFVRFDPRGRPSDVESPLSELGGRERMLAFLAAGGLGAFTTYSGLVAWLGSGMSQPPSSGMVVELLVMLLLGPVMVLLGFSIGGKHRSSFDSHS